MHTEFLQQLVCESECENNNNLKIFQWLLCAQNESKVVQFGKKACYQMMLVSFGLVPNEEIQNQFQILQDMEISEILEYHHIKYLKLQRQMNKPIDDRTFTSCQEIVLAIAIYVSSTSFSLLSPIQCMEYFASYVSPLLQLIIKADADKQTQNSVQFVTSKLQYLNNKIATIKNNEEFIFNYEHIIEDYNCKNSLQVKTQQEEENTTTTTDSNNYDISDDALQSQSQTEEEQEVQIADGYDSTYGMTQKDKDILRQNLEKSVKRKGSLFAKLSGLKQWLFSSCVSSAQQKKNKLKRSNIIEQMQQIVY